MERKNSITSSELDRQFKEELAMLDDSDGSPRGEVNETAGKADPFN